MYHSVIMDSYTCKIVEPICPLGDCGLWGYNPHQAMLEGLQSSLTLTFPSGYHPLGQSLEFASIIFTINNVSVWPESDRWEHFNPKTVDL